MAVAETVTKAKPSTMTKGCFFVRWTGCEGDLELICDPLSQFGEIRYDFSLPKVSCGGQGTPLVA